MPEPILFQTHKAMCILRTLNDGHKARHNFFPPHPNITKKTHTYHNCVRAYTKHIYAYVRQRRYSTNIAFFQELMAARGTYFSK